MGARLKYWRRNWNERRLGRKSGDWSSFCEFPFSFRFGEAKTLIPGHKRAGTAPGSLRVPVCTPVFVNISSRAVHFFNCSHCYIKLMIQKDVWQGKMESHDRVLKVSNTICASTHMTERDWSRVPSVDNPSVLMARLSKSPLIFFLLVMQATRDIRYYRCHWSVSVIPVLSASPCQLRRENLSKCHLHVWSTVLYEYSNLSEFIHNFSEEAHWWANTEVFFLSTFCT